MSRTPARLVLILAASLVGARGPGANASREASSRRTPLWTLRRPPSWRCRSRLAWRRRTRSSGSACTTAWPTATFGKRTRDSIVAFQLSQKGDGRRRPLRRPAPGAARGRAKRRAPPSASRPSPTRRPAPGSARPRGSSTPRPGSRSTSRPTRAATSPASMRGSPRTRRPARSPTRRSKPGAFFVVSGEDGGRKFYTRYDSSAAATPPIRGFTFAYPATRNDLDRVALAVANSFRTVPSAGPGRGRDGGIRRAGGPPRRRAAVPSATALIVAPGRALTALKAGDCPNPSVGGKPAKFERTDAATGLALLSGDFGAKAEPPARGALDLRSRGARAPTASRVSAVSAALSGGGSRAVAALEKSASGRPAFDRSGGLAGVVAPIAEEPKRVGGVALAVPHAMIDAECDRRLSRRRRADSDRRPRAGPAQRRRDRGARKTGGRGGYVPPAMSPEHRRSRLPVRTAARACSANRAGHRRRPATRTPAHGRRRRGSGDRPRLRPSRRRPPIVSSARSSTTESKASNTSRNGSTPSRSARPSRRTQNGWCGTSAGDEAPFANGRPGATDASVRCASGLRQPMWMCSWSCVRTAPELTMRSCLSRAGAAPSGVLTSERARQASAK